MANEGENQYVSRCSTPSDIFYRQVSEIDDVSLSSSASSIGSDGLKLPRVYEWVSRWTEPMLKKYFNIECVGDLTGEDVLQMAGISTKLNPVQAEYLSDLESIIIFDEAPKLGNIRSRSKHLKLILQEILKKLSPDSEYFTDLRKQSGHLSLLSNGTNVIAFIRNMEKYITLIEESEDFAPEGFYKELAGRFADMCLLVEFEPLKSFWKNLKGINVISKPDLRLFKKESNGPALCVIEVKRDTDSDTTDYFQSPSPKRRKRSLSPRSSVDFSTTSSSQVKRSRHGTNSFTEKVKGQHAGELLLDLYSMKKKPIVNNTNYYMPGLVVDATSIAMTMLVISKTHFDRIDNNEPLGEDDKGKIYFSWFYDFMMEKQRSSLIKFLLNLNNISDFET